MTHPDLYEAVTNIKSGVPYDVVVDSLLNEARKRGGKSDLWREILLTLYRKVREARSAGLDTTKTNVWLKLLSSTSKEWHTTNQNIVHFLLAFKILDKIKRGELTNENITRIYSRLIDTENPRTLGSEEALDTYLAARGVKEIKDPSAHSKSTERHRLPTHDPARRSTRRWKKKKKKKKDK